MVLSQAFYCYQDRSRMFKGKGHTTRNRLIKKKNARGFTYFQNKNVPAIFRSTEAEVFLFLSRKQDTWNSKHFKL